MNYELVTIIFTITGTGAVVTGLIMPRLSTIDNHIAELRERMARLEDLFEGFTGRTPQ